MFGGLFSSSEKKFSDDLIQFLIYVRTIETEDMKDSTDTIPLVNQTWEELNSRIVDDVSLPLTVAFIYFWLLMQYGEQGDTVFGHLAKQLRAAMQHEALELVPMVLDAHKSAIDFAGKNGDDSQLGNPAWVISRGFCDILYGPEKGANAALVLFIARFVAHRIEVVEVGVREIGLKHLGPPKSS